MSGEHYFSEAPGSEFRPREIQVELAGRRLSVTTANGVFSPDHVDTGTQVLLDAVPPAPPGGHLLDLGCGWGPIALAMALDAPHATVWAVDVNPRSLDLTRGNAQRLGLDNVRAVTPDEVPDDLAFGAIRSNPPIRVGKAVTHGMLSRWLPRLEAGADAHLVVQKNLGADSLARWLLSELGAGWSVLRVDSAKGFRVIRARRRQESSTPE